MSSDGQQESLQSGEAGRPVLPETGSRAVQVLVFGGTVLTAVALLVWGVMVKGFATTSEEVWAATVAAGVCWSSVLPGLALFVLRDGADWGMMAAGVAMILRLFVCLGVVVMLGVVQHPLLRAGVAEMMTVSYLAMLVTETGLFVAISHRWPASR